ncbi:HAD family acid phosphatase [Legionella yabuuchiae]|uniref:HAD family acid phosphatase n=1 Tax=Legionella yabuuchiae TaxID=376727 RepID=UPI0010564ADC|nr:HAD family acid phosphatase [Legionella yabuuchiae]
MTNFPILTRTLFAILLSAFIHVNVHAEPANLHLLMHEVKAYHDNGDYDNEVIGVVEQAREYINKRAELNAKTHHPQKLALVLDIDETSLTNYDKMAARHFIATKVQLHREIMAADAPAIKPILSLYHDALKHDIKVFFVTGRKESERNATSKNLKRAGFNTWSGLYLKPDNYSRPSIIPFKSKAREAIERKGYTIIASIGDQISDLKGGFAEKTFKLPNPYYHLP